MQSIFILKPNVTLKKPEYLGIAFFFVEIMKLINEHSKIRIDERE